MQYKYQKKERDGKKMRKVPDKMNICWLYIGSAIYLYVYPLSYISYVLNNLIKFIDNEKVDYQKLVYRSSLVLDSLKKNETIFILFYIILLVKNF